MKYYNKKLQLLMMLLLCGIMTVWAQTLPYQDTSKSFHERAVDLVSRLTLAEKAQQMGNNVNTPIDRDDESGTGRVTLPMYQYWNEALHGVARSGAATSFPESKGMSSTWDKQLIFDCATVISDEARIYNNVWNKGLNYWCPTINMARDPRWGRDEENYGEDPFLAGVLAVQFIKGMQGNDPTYLKTVACAKHFAANNYEQGRQGSTSYMTKHNLREYYLPAFEMSVKEGKVKSIMSSYNALSTDINEENANGQSWAKGNTGGKAWGGKPNAMNDWLLTGILRNEWGFDGYVTSDCAGVSCIYRNVKHGYFGPNDDGSELQEDYKARATAAAIKAGNDMNCEFKNQTSIFQTAVEAAISKGYMTEEDLDQALIRVLETRFALGEFDGSNPWSSLDQSDLESTANQTMALKAAQESIVLLKNGIPEGGSNPLLPISTEKSVALIGPYANQIQLGDYSGTPTYTTTPFQAFATKMNFTVSDGTIQAESFTSKSSGANGVDANYPNELANTAPGVWFCYANVDFGTTPCKDFIMACAAKNTGVATVNFILDDPDGDPFLSVNNVDNNSWHSMTTVNATIDEAKRPSGVHTLYVKFTGSNKYAGNYDYFRFYNEGANPYEDLGPLYMVQTTDAVNDVASEEMIARAVAVAQKADVVVFCGGTDFSKPADHATGTESHDRWKLTMPGNQTALLQALYAVNKNIVLVLETNSSMDITWEKANLPAILEAWYGGQAQGQAICDVIYGDVNPSGKLTSTWYNSIDELPSESDSQFGAKGMLEYNIDDWGYTYMYYKKGTGANVSRQAAAPMYPFGYGLSYTTFAYSNPTIASDHVTFTITNTGTRAGAEVAQVYVSFPNSAVSHIQKLNRRLVGFERVELAAGQSKEVTIPINKDQLAYYNDDTDEWWVEGGTVNVYISASSADDRLTGSFVATAEKLDRTVSNTSEPEPEPEEPITGISIPTTSESYILWNDANATIENATVENGGANIGSTGASTVATFAIGNSTQQDYILTFKTGSKNTAKMLVTLTNKKTSDVALSKTVDILNTGSWTPSTVHTFLISQLPKGNYELKMKVTEAASYAGNWGDLAFHTTDTYNKAPGSIGIATGTYNGPKLENNNTNVGYVSNGGTATYSFICSQGGVYKMTTSMKKYGDGTIHVTVTDDKTGNVEADGTWTVAANTSDYADIDIPIDGELTYGMKTMTLQFATDNSFLCNYKDITTTRIADHYAKIAGVAVTGLETTASEDCDCLIQLPAVYDATTTFSVDAKYGTVTASSEGVEITDNGDGTFTLATPAPGTTISVTLTLTPADGTISGKTTYVLKLFRIGEISIVDATVDGISIGTELLATLNDELAAEYQNVYTILPTVKLQCVDGNWFVPVAATEEHPNPVIADNKATYSFHITMADKEKDYTLTIDGIHIYNKEESDETVQLKYTGDGNDKDKKVWSNGVYSLSPVGDGWNNSGFKLSKNDNPFTLTVPSDVQVKQFIIRDFKDNYADGSFNTITSDGMTAWIPVKHNLGHTDADKYDLLITLDNHKAGEPIVFSFEGGSQITGWYELAITKQNPGSAPEKTGQNVTVVNNHAVVAVTFDREIANDVQATINNTTVTAEGGAATLFFPVWGLDYSSNYTLTIPANAVEDAYGNKNSAAIEIAVNTGAKATVTQAAYDYVVSTTDEFKNAVAAVNASNNSKTAARKTIFLKNGDYNLGDGGNESAWTTVLWLNAHNVSLIGESRDGVVIRGRASGISNPVLNIRNGSGQYLQDLTIRNDFDWENYVNGNLKVNGVAVALYGGNKAVMKNVSMQSNQDTQVTGERAYYQNCDIHGTVDYICGGGTHYYDHCSLVMEGGGYITAPSTSSSLKYGYVFESCTISDKEGIPASGYFLGRPWQDTPKATFLNTRMLSIGNAKAWSAMSNSATELNAYFYEYGSKDANGAPVDLSQRSVNGVCKNGTYDPILSAEEAAKFTIENVMGGTDSWLPTEECPTLNAPTHVSVSGTTLSWDAVEDARCYVIFKDGQYLTNLTGTSFETDGTEAVYSVCAANLNGGLGVKSDEVGMGLEVANENQDYTPVAQEGVKVRLTRTIKAGNWSTFILPFALNETQIKGAFGEDVLVATLAGSTETELQFDAVTSMEANKPYAIKVTSDFNGADIENVNIVEPVATTVTVGNWSFVGTYSKTNIPTGGYFFSGNKIYRAADNTNTIKPFRAYLVNNGVTARVLDFVLNSETTYITTTNDKNNTNHEWFTLDGRKLSGKPSAKGMYIVNGKKVVIK